MFVLICNSSPKKLISGEKTVLQVISAGCYSNNCSEKMGQDDVRQGARLYHYSPPFALLGPIVAYRKSSHQISYQLPQSLLNPHFRKTKQNNLVSATVTGPSLLLTFISFLSVGILPLLHFGRYRTAIWGTGTLSERARVGSTKDPLVNYGERRQSYFHPISVCWGYTI